jgi:hypothetical protein
VTATFESVKLTKKVRTISEVSPAYNQPNSEVVSLSSGCAVSNLADHDQWQTSEGDAALPEPKKSG